jgi:hypothetical protein
MSELRAIERRVELRNCNRRGIAVMMRLSGRLPRRFGLSLAVLLSVLFGGCGRGLYPVEGVVVWEDGSPATELAGSHVVFDLPEKRTSARGIVGADGSFHLTTNKPNDGALPGEYRVVIIETRKPAGGPDSGDIAPGVIDTSYYDPATSGLRATVRAGANKIKLTVRRGRGR